MLKNLLALISLMLASLSIAAPYHALDIDKIALETDDGQHELSFRALDEAVEAIWQHARGYPVKFDSAAEQEKAQKDVKTLMEFIPYIREEIVKADADKALNQHLQLLEARVAVMAYNFDDVSALSVADKRYEGLLQENATPELYREYGVFLASSMRAKKAEEMLQKALAGGEKSALYSLGLLALQKEDGKQGRAYLVQYLESYPNNETAKKLVEALDNGDLQFKSCVYDEKSGECRSGEE